MGLNTIELIDLVIDLDLSRPAGVRTFSLTSPDRLVFDIEDAEDATMLSVGLVWSFGD